jgi:hypothetical protein
MKLKSGIKRKVRWCFPRNEANGERVNGKGLMVKKLIGYWLRGYWANGLEDKRLNLKLLIIYHGTKL